MSIRPRIIILPLSIVPYLGPTKTSDLTFIWFYNVWLESYRMVVTTSMSALSWSDDVHVCAVMVFVPYPLHKFRLLSSFSYWWLCHLYVLMSYHILSADYVRVQLCSFYLFSLYIYTGFYSLSILFNLNHIYKTLLGWGRFHL